MTHLQYVPELTFLWARLDNKFFVLRVASYPKPEGIWSQWGCKPVQIQSWYRRYTVISVHSLCRYDRNMDIVWTLNIYTWYGVILNMVINLTCWVKGWTKGWVQSLTVTLSCNLYYGCPRLVYIFIKQNRTRLTSVALKHTQTQILQVLIIRINNNSENHYLFIETQSKRWKTCICSKV